MKYALWDYWLVLRSLFKSAPKPAVAEPEPQPEPVPVSQECGPTIRVVCPRCGDVDVQPSTSVLKLDVMTEASWLVFVCSVCGNRDTTSSLGWHLESQLAKAGVPTEFWWAPAQERPIKAPQITYDELLEVHQLLEDNELLVVSDFELL
jgi:hypothetical protein